MPGPALQGPGRGTASIHHRVRRAMLEVASVRGRCRRWLRPASPRSQRVERRSRAYAAPEDFNDGMGHARLAIDRPVEESILCFGCWEPAAEQDGLAR